MPANRRQLLGGAAMAAAASATVPAKAQAPDRAIPSADQAVKVINLRDLEARAEKVLPRGEFDYIAGASGDEWTAQENEAAFKRVTLAPQFLSGVAKADMSTTLLGAAVSCPILIPPMGGHGMAHASAEAGTARAAAAEGVLLTASTMSTLPLESIAKAADGPKWFQLYMPSDRGFATELIGRAKAAGYLAVVFTIDAGGANRERNLKNGFAVGTESAGNWPGRPSLKAGLDWGDVEFVQKTSGLPVILKGVLTEGLVTRAARGGLAGVQVSNHGGRAVDDSPATITVLPRLVQAADGKLLIILDSGVRRGSDAFKALALGAHAIGIGRPILWGLALGGAPGVRAVLARAKAELALAMTGCGAATVSGIDRSMVYA